MSVNAAVRPTRSTRSIGWVPFALVALVVIPAIAGSLRLVELAGGDQLLPANPRITASPAPVVVHILCAVAYAILGAFQFSGALRRRWPGWHRVAGRVLVVLGLAVAFSALWMTQFYPRAPGGSKRSAAATSPATGHGWRALTHWHSVPGRKCSPWASGTSSSASANSTLPSGWARLGHQPRGR